MSSFPTDPRIPDGAQPGGGWCMSIERAWGRARRGMLRLFRPAYVRRMAQLRQGACQRHAGDVIDHRDLKYIRPACGYSFPAGSQPHPCQPFLGLARYGLCEVLVFSLLFVLIGGGLAALAALLHWAFWIPFAAVALVYLEILFFFRDPNRVIPADPDILVSPADGVVTNVEEVEEVEFSGKALRISIFLSIFNVHLNRMPSAVRVTQVRYFPGAYLDARNPDSAARNEQLWIDAEDRGSGIPVRVKQISGAIARRIVCWIKPGDELERGERLGMIKLGSRTDLILSLEKVQQVCVKVGDAVLGGRSILLRLASSAELAPDA